MRAALALFVTLLALRPCLGEGFTLNAQVLARYGFTLEQYQAMPASEQEKLEEWIRLRELALRSAGAPAPAPPQAPKWSPEKMKALERLEENAGAATKAGAFDGALVPHLDVFGDGQPRRFSLDGPHGLVLEAGRLGLDGRSPLVEPSPYVGVGQDASGSGPALDWEAHTRLYALGLGARLYTDDAPALDARIDQGVGSLGTLDPVWGIKPGQVDSLRGALSFSHGFQRDWLPVGSAMARAGRAYHLLPGLDAGWSSMAVLRLTGLFPNVALDETGGLRYTTAGGAHVGLFGGVTEAPGLFDKTMVADSLAAEKFKTDVHVDAAPHAEAAAWGRLPYLSSVEYTLSAGQQWNPWTSVRSLAASASAPAGRGRVGVFGSYSDESGPDLEFDRRKAAAGVEVSPSDGLDFWAQYRQDHAKFGSAQMDSKGVLLGMTVQDAAGPAEGSSVTLETLFGGKEQLVSAADQADSVKLLQELLAGIGGLEVAPSDWRQAQQAWNALPPDAQALLQQVWSQADPGAPPLATLFSIKPSDFATLDRLVDLLTDTKVLERLMVRLVRSKLLEKLDAVDIPVLGRNVRMSPALVIAAAHSYGLSLSPVPPVTAKDIGSLDALMLDKLGGKAGCQPGPQPQTATDCILSNLPDGVRQDVEKNYAGFVDVALKAAVSWPAGVLRREVDRMALQVILAAETLDELSVDHGERIADLNVRGLMRSFDRLDERSQAVDRRALGSAERDLGAELQAQDRALRAQLTDYGAARLAWLQSQPAWPSNVGIAVRPEDWAPLLAAYGDAKLFDFVLKCKAELAASRGSAPARVLLELDRTPLQSVMVSRGAVTVISLPAKGADLSLFDLAL